MIKLKKDRIKISLLCLFCYDLLSKKRQFSSFKYYTEKNKKNTKVKIILKKYCPFCNKHTPFSEIK
jgi:large subunit ribosomal protein L33